MNAIKNRDIKVSFDAGGRASRVTVRVTRAADGQIRAELDGLQGRSFEASEEKAITELVRFHYGRNVVDWEYFSNT